MTDPPNDLIEGPSAAFPYTFEQATDDDGIGCTFTQAGKKLGGNTLKFLCRTADGHDLRLKYWHAQSHTGNREVFAAVAASRLMWSLGFEAVPALPINVRCDACPENPMQGSGARRTRRYVAMFQARWPVPILSGDSVDQGWSWLELDTAILSLPPGLERARRRTHFDALTLLGVFMQHGDRKPEQQRLYCAAPVNATAGELRAAGADMIPMLFERPDASACREPAVTIVDVGATFGGAGRGSNKTTSKMNLEAGSENPSSRTPTPATAAATSRCLTERAATANRTRSFRRRGDASCLNNCTASRQTTCARSSEPRGSTSSVMPGVRANPRPAAIRSMSGSRCFRTRCGRSKRDVVRPPTDDSVRRQRLMAEARWPMRKLIAVLLCLGAGGVLHAADPNYHVVNEIQIGGDGGWDYVIVDSATRRLYVSHATKIVVADIDTGKIVGEIPDTPGVHGIAIASDLGRAFTSNGRANSSTIVDLKTLKPLATVATGANPDSIRYLQARKEVWTFNHTGGSITAFDPMSAKVIATIDVGGELEEAVEDSSANRVYVNVEDKGTIAVVDTLRHAVVATWPLDGCEGPTGLAFDPTNHLLLSACDGKMAVTDSRSGKAVTSFPIAPRVDGNGFDAATGLAFASSGTGVLTIAHQDAPDRFTVVQTATTQPSGRTMWLDPVAHKIYVPVATTAPGPGGRPQAVSGTMKILVLGMEP